MLTYLHDGNFKHAAFLGFFNLLVHAMCRLKILFVQQRELATDLCQWLQLLDDTR
jgi:hypothetical protein